MPGLNRREALALLGAGAAGAVCAAAAPGRSAPPVPERSRLDLDVLADRFQDISRDRALEVAAAAIRAGADRTALLGAIFLCGVRDIRPRPHGILHTVMMVESSFQLSEAAPQDETWLPVLWNLDDLKTAQAGDRVEAGDWKLGPARGRRAVTADSARREFVAAMEAWDPERADRALVDLLPHQDHDSFFEILWPLACRCSAFIGHKMIHTVQIERVLRRIGWTHAEPALRTLVMTLLVDRETPDIGRARELAATMATVGRRPHEDPAQSAALLTALRGSGAAEAQEQVLRAAADGLGAPTIWDGLRLLGSEIFLRRPGRTAAAGRPALLPVHAFTVTSAFGHAWRASARDETRRLLLLQAAAWLTRVRDAVVSVVDLSMQGPGIDALGQGIDAPGRAGRDLDQVLDLASPGTVRIALDREPGLAAAYVARVRSGLFHKAREHHQVKYAAAMAEESRLADPRWASRILAPGGEYAAHPRDVDTEVYRRSVSALKRAGVA